MSKSKPYETMRIIDFRVRPPVAAYRILFDVTLSRVAEKNEKIIVPGIVHAESVKMAGKDENAALDLLAKEVDAAHVSEIVMPGRNTSAVGEVGAVAATTKQKSFNVSDELLVKLIKRFNNRAYGLHGIDLAKPVKEIVEDITKGVREYGMKGAVIEPGYAKDTDGGPLSLATPRLFPIYDTMIELDAVLMVQGGIYAGPDINTNDCGPLDRVMQKFPKMKTILAHGGYPRILDAISLVCKHDNVYISPDVYCFFPGGQLYIDAISQLPDQFVFASAYPLGDIKTSVDLALKFPLKEDVMKRYMGGNAARLLKL